MNTPKLLVALQGTGKCSRAWNIANQIAEFQRAKIHALNLTRLDAANTAHDDPAKNQSEPQSPKGCLPEFFADKDADTALQGNLAQQRIYKTAREINADLVIVGTDRRTGLHRLLPSATHRLCDAIACHLLAVRSNGPVDGYRRISIAMDPSRSPIKVNETALTFARMATTVKFVIVTPMPLSTPLHLEDISGSHWSSMADAVRFKRQIRSEAADALRSAGLHPKILEVRTGDTFHEILACATDMRADLLIISQDKQQPRNRWLSRSTVARLLNRMPCDVLVCRD